MSSTDITRGDLIVVRVVPKDADGNQTTPFSVQLYLNYLHADGTATTDDPIEMALNSDGQWEAEWDSAVALAGLLQGSVRTVSPSAAVDFKRKIVANDANPDPT